MRRKKRGGFTQTPSPSLFLSKETPLSIPFAKVTLLFPLIQIKPLGT
jgi:hypothetical protein